MITASSATANVNPIVVKMLGGGTPSLSISAANAVDAVARLHRTAVTAAVVVPCGFVSVSSRNTAVSGEAHGVCLAAHATASVRENVTRDELVGNAVGAICTRTELDMRVDVTTVRRDVDARTAKGARTPTLVAKTEAIDGWVDLAIAKMEAWQRSSASIFVVVLSSSKVFKRVPTLRGAQNAAHASPTMSGSPRCVHRGCDDDSGADADATLVSARAAARPLLERALDDAMSTASAHWHRERDKLLAERAAVESIVASLEARVVDLETRNACLEVTVRETKETNANAAELARGLRAALDEKNDDDETKMQKLVAESKVWEDACVKYRKRMDHAERGLARLTKKANAHGFVEATQFEEWEGPRRYDNNVTRRGDGGDENAARRENKLADSSLALLPAPALAPVANRPVKRPRDHPATSFAPNARVFRGAHQGTANGETPNRTDAFPNTTRDIRNGRDQLLGLETATEPKRKRLDGRGDARNQNATRGGDTFHAPNAMPGWRRNRLPAGNATGKIRGTSPSGRGIDIDTGNANAPTTGGFDERGLWGATQVVPSGRKKNMTHGRADAFENEQTEEKRGDFFTSRADPRGVSDRDFFTIGGAQKTKSKFHELDDTNAMPPPGRGNTDATRETRNPDETSEEEEKEIKKVEVVREKFAREKLPAFACEQCEKFYTATGRPVLEGKPGEACAHCPGPNRMNDWSRHRAKWAPPPAPAGFWNLDLTPAERR